MALALYRINPAGVFYFGVMILVGAVVYFGLLVSLKGIKREEIGFLREIFKI